MISLSNLIKSSQYMTVRELKQLNHTQQHRYQEDAVDEGQLSEYDELNSAKDAENERVRKQIIDDAAEYAEEQIRLASEEAERIVAEAKHDADIWWQERRQEDEQLVEMSRLDGFEQGYQEGIKQAEEATRAQVEQMMAEAKMVLEQAYRAKDQIIQEAEPFLVDLSCAVAEKIVEKHLSDDPDYAVELIKKLLNRKREKGTISLCVAPEHFAFVQAAREELSLAVDSQAELQILPDSTVSDWGCVIRSPFGSIDARIDTQLSEIKKELVQIAMHDERVTDDE